MTNFRRLVRAKVGRSTSFVQIVLLLASTSCVHPGAASPGPGLYDYQSRLLVAVPGGRVNAAGGNLIVERVDLSIDTLFGTQEVGAVYNSASGRWVWSFDVRYDGDTFVDASGAEHRVVDLEAGRAIPGTTWVKQGDSRIKSKGGMEYTFDPLTGRLAEVRWVHRDHPSLIHHVSQVSGTDRVVAVEQCRYDETCTSVYTIEYDGHGCVERLTGRGGRVALFDHDSSCRLLAARDALDVARGWPGSRYEYEGDALTAIVSSEGERVEYDYLAGRLVQASAVGAEQVRRTTFAYGFDATRSLYFTRADSPGSGVTVYRYDSFGRMHEATDARGGLTRISWSGARPNAITDVAGVTTRWVYEDDDPVEVTLATGNVVSIEYEPEARNREDVKVRPLRRVADSMGTLLTHTYNSYGSRTSSSNGAGEEYRYIEDHEGNLATIIAPSGEVTQLMSFGDHGHPESVERHSQFDHRIYDAVGNLIAGEVIEGPISPGRPGIRRLVYDEDRNVVGIELSGGSDTEPFGEHVAVLSIERRSDGQPTRIERPYGGDTELHYDAFGQLAERRERAFGQWWTTRVERDPAGRVTAIERPNGMRREVAYDSLGHEVSIRLLQDGVLEQQLEQRYEGGRLIWRRDSSYSGDETFAYDAAGRLVSVRYPGGEVLELGYDLRSRETLRRFRAGPSGAVIRSLGFDFDAAGRQDRIYDDGQLVLERVFGDGLVREMRYGNGVVRELEYLADSELLSSSRTWVAGNDLIESTEMQWAPCGGPRLCIVSDSLATGTLSQIWPGSFATEGYGLDPKPGAEPPQPRPGQRLRAWSSSYDPDFVWGPENQQAYDALGNRLGVGNGVALAERFVYNAEHNRLLSLEGETPRDYAYDEAGFLVRRDDRTIEWDAGGRPRDLGDGSELDWDVLGRPVRSRVDGVESRFRFGGRVRGDALGNPVSIDLGDVHIFLGSGEHIYRQYDFRGNVQLVTSESGEVLRHYAYSPWGPKQVTGDFPDRRGFAGGTEIGDFILLGARLYDPETGRFISPDPVAHPINQYAYTLGNPVAFWDPSGLYAISTSGCCVGRLLYAIGLALVPAGVAFATAGVMTANPGVVHGGFAIMAAGFGLMIFGAMLGAPGCACGPGPGGGNGPPAQTPSPRTPDSLEVDMEVDPAAVGCSPTALTASRTSTRPLLVLLPLQLLLAWMLVRRRRERS